MRATEAEDFLAQTCINHYFATSVLPTGELPPAAWQQGALSLATVD